LRIKEQETRLTVHEHDYDGDDYDDDDILYDSFTVIHSNLFSPFRIPY